MFLKNFLKLVAVSVFLMSAVYADHGHGNGGYGNGNSGYGNGNYGNGGYYNNSCIVELQTRRGRMLGSYRSQGCFTAKS